MSERAGYSEKIEDHLPVIIKSYRSDQLETMYFDGFGSAAVGPAVTKIDLFLVSGVDQAQGAEKPTETRIVDQVFVIPTMSVFSFSVQMIMSYIENSELMDAAPLEIRKSVNVLVEALKAR